MLSSKIASIVSKIQMIDQKDMITADKFFESINVIIIREGNATRDITRNVTRKRSTRVIQQSSRRRDKNEEFTIIRKRQRDIATSTYMKDNEIMFYFFQL